MTVLHLPDPRAPWLTPEDADVEIARVLAAVQDADPEVRSCGRVVMRELYKSGGECFTITELREKLDDHAQAWLLPTLAFLEVEGCVGKHMPDEGDAMHYFLTNEGADRIEAN